MALVAELPPSVRPLGQATLRPPASGCGTVGDLTVPGGGRKNSGRGEYEGAGDGIAFFTHLKPIFYKLIRGQCSPRTRG